MSTFRIARGHKRDIRILPLSLSLSLSPSLSNPVIFSLNGREKRLSIRPRPSLYPSTLSRTLPQSLHSSPLPTFELEIGNSPFVRETRITTSTISDRLGIDGLRIHLFTEFFRFICLPNSYNQIKERFFYPALFNSTTHTTPSTRFGGRAGESAALSGKQQKRVLVSYAFHPLAELNEPDG